MKDSESPNVDQPTADQPSFEEALEQLERIVEHLEDGRIGLNEALAGYEKGVGLLRQCHELLQKAERRIELLSGIDADGNPLTMPLDDEETTLAEKSRRRSRRRSAPRRPDPGDETTSEEGGDNLDMPGGLF